MRLAMLFLFVPSLAVAETAPSFEILDRGTAVEVIAHNVTAARTAITPIRSRLEVPLVGHPRADKALQTDATIKQIEFDGNEQRVLSVKLNFDRPEVKALAKYAQAIQVGSDVHILVPRAVPAEGTAFVMPEPTLPAEIAAKIESAKAEPAPVAEVTPTEEIQAAPVVETKPAVAEVKPEVKSETKPEAKPEPAAAIAKPATAAPAKEGGINKLSMYAAIGLAGIGIGAWLLRRRKQAHGPTTSIDVIAQKSLGAKAKVVWFTAGGREMVVAVTPQQVRMLGQWKKPAEGSGHITLPTAHALPEAPQARASSPAVAGILKLRERPSMQRIPLHEDIATDDVDADEAWAKEILAATGARR